MKKFLLSFSLYTLGSAPDVIGTKYALSHCYCQELNATMKYPILTKLVFSAGLAGIETGVEGKKTKKAMKITWGVINVGLGAYAIHRSNRDRIRN